MRSIPQALLWEGLVRGRWSVLGMFLVGNAIPCMVYEALSGYRISLNETALPFLVLQFSFLQLIILQFAIGIAIAQGPMSRLFTWPISSHAIVAWHSLSGSLLLAVETALAASLYNWLFQAGWPILGPAVFAAVAWTAIQLLQFIRVQPSLSGMCVWCSPLLFLIFWLSSRFGSFLSPPKYYWHEATTGDLLTLAIVAAICYGMAIAGVRVARSGEQLPQIGFSDWLSRQWESLTLWSSIRSNFRSAVHAQLWHEFKLRGWAPPFISSIVTSLAMIAIARVLITGDWSFIESREILSAIPALVMWITAFPIVWGAIFAFEDSSNLGEKRDKSGSELFDPKTSEAMGSFLATLPFDNKMFADVILWTVAKSTISVLLPVLPVLVIIWFANVMPSLVSDPGIGAWWLPLVLITPWICMANAASFAFIAQCGSKTFLITLGVACILLPIARLLLSDALFVQSVLPASTAVSIAIVVITIWVFDRSHRINPLTTRTQRLCVAIVLAIFVTAYLCRPTNPPIVAFPFLLAVASLAVLPFAALPLTIGASRHR